MTAELLALLDSDPAAGILAVADLREQRAKAATQGVWFTASRENHGDTWWLWADDAEQAIPEPLAVIEAEDFDWDQDTANAEHIAAEANPAHALAAVHRWRGVVERHGKPDVNSWDPDDKKCTWCGGYTIVAGLGDRGFQRCWPCPDLTETADEARAYLGGES